MEAVALGPAPFTGGANAGTVRSGAWVRRRAALAHLPLTVAAVLAVTASCHLRWSIASTTTWQCDEIPLLVRSTGLCGHVGNEAEARRFQPSFYSWYMGAMRGLRPPKDIAAIHTTTNFWVNLTTHLFGVTPAAGRLMPFVFSVAAIGLAAWLTWLASGRFTAACFAAVIVAWSPHAIAYGAQARGYAEAMAFAPLLLITLELLRRKPTSWFRAAAALLVAIELSLTVYTAWLYWTFPALAVAVLFLPCAPGTSPDAARRATMRVVAMVIAVGACLFMGIYTIDRWTQLTFTAANMGISVASWREVWSFGAAGMEHHLPAPLWLSGAIVIGAAALRRSNARWWLAVMALGCMVPVLFGVLNGSAGYPRNLGYLVVPLAALGAVGADVVLRSATKRLPQVTGSIVAAAVVLGGSARTYAEGSTRARAIILPDWGAAVLAVDEQPETVGPRWFCRCLANHWQINWYRANEDLDRFLTRAPGASFEVVLGTQRDERGREIVFRADSAAAAVVPATLPEYLATTPIAQTVSGVNLRRWRAAGIGLSTIPASPADRPVFVWLVSPTGVNGFDPIRDLLAADQERQVVTFKPVDHGGRVIHSLILPAKLLPMIRALENTPPGARAISVRAYGMERVIPTP